MSAVICCFIMCVWFGHSRNLQFFVVKTYIMLSAIKTNAVHGKHKSRSISQCNLFENPCIG